MEGYTVPLRYFNITSTLQDVPNELSMCINIAGCPWQCEGCSWKKVTEGMTRYELTITDLQNILRKDNNNHSCICFMGGDWENDLIYFVKEAKTYGYKTCLYTGGKTIHTDLLKYLDYIKVGAYKKELGGLDSPITNQRLLTIGDQTKCFQKSK